MIKAKEIYKSFDDHHVLNGLTLDIETGETMVIMGGSGCGKSVFLKLIIGLIKPDRGKIWIDGLDTTDFSEKEMDGIRKRFGMVFQSAALFDSLTVGENVAFGVARHTDMNREQIKKLVAEKLEMVGLGGIENTMPVDLSGGMRKRVSLARAISMEPEVILYDEPTTGLDPVTSEEINNLIIGLHNKLNVTSLVVTHDMNSAFSIATRMALLNKGEIAAVGMPDEFRNTTNPIVKKFLGHSVPNYTGTGL